jgi:hypothetical protein
MDQADALLSKFCRTLGEIMPEIDGAVLLQAFQRLNQVRKVSERDREPVPHWVIQEVCAVVDADLAARLATDPDNADEAEAT